MENELPDGWELKKLTDICLRVTDGTHDTPKYVSEGIPLITSKNLTYKGIDFENVKYISESDHLFISKRSGVEKGDILFAMIGTIGNPVIVETDRKFSIKNVALFKVDKSKIINQYLVYYLKSRLLSNYFTESAKGTTQKFISLNMFRELMISVPPMNVQKQIVAKLDKFFREYDILKEEKEKVKENHEKILQSVIEKTIFFEELPEGWKIDKLKNLCKNIQYGLTANSVNEQVGPVYLRITDINANGSLNGEFRYVKISDEDYSKFKLHDEDIVIARTGATVGKSFIVKESNIDMVFASYLIRFEVDKQKILPELLNMYLNSLSYWNHISDKQVGIGQPNVNATKLGDFEIAYPEDLVVQRRLMDKILSLKKDCNVVVNEQEVLERNLTMLPHSVLTKAFAGELV